MKRFNHIWRILATGFCFVSFGGGGLLLSVLVFPLLWVLPMNPQIKQIASQTVIHQAFRFFVAMMQFVGVLRVSIIGLEKLSHQKNYFILSNHPTLIDVVLLISLLPKTDCIVKQALWRNFFLMGVVSSAGYISNSGDPERLIQDCVDCLQAGRSLIIFPEGTRTRPGKPLKFQRGAANIALRAGKDITPITIICDPPTLTKSEKWYNVPADRLVRIMLKIGDDIAVSPFSGSGHTTLAARKLTEYLQNYFQEEVKNHE